ncbi:hypothetical protein P3T76_009075 [Phytophthora citrophthora]|uniref:Uncharacterized protein n=1 Tax=Phytophthora citrophthora TaxID=4793 RepID=A0AAD9GID0_9STRA|nr:hypothetical protein P3T76_009075 [Phytophthora citrophthora]
MKRVEKTAVQETAESVGDAVVRAIGQCSVRTNPGALRAIEWARMCTDHEAKARNDEYMRMREMKPPAIPENEQRTA